MNSLPLKILLIEQDAIFRLGLRVLLSEFPNIEVVTVADNETLALQILAELAQQDSQAINLAVMELGNGRTKDSQQMGLQLLKQLKSLYPNLPVLLFTNIQEPGLLLAAKAFGVNGYFPKGYPVSELIAAMEEVANGGFYWEQEKMQTNIPNSDPFSIPHSPFPLFQLRNRLRLDGINQIEANLRLVNAKLQSPDLQLVEKAIITGKRRELLAARWLVNHLLVLPQEKLTESDSDIISDNSLSENISKFSQLTRNRNLSFSSAINPSDSLQRQNISPLLSPVALQSELLSKCINKLQYPLHNVSDSPLEIDILRLEKKRELLYIILEKFADSLEYLRESNIDLSQISELKEKILTDLWQAATTDFFGKFTQVKVGMESIEIVNLLLKNSHILQNDILYKIPLVENLLAFLLFQTNLQIDNIFYPAGSLEALDYASMLLENLLINVGNAVLQPLLNSLADIEEIKQIFYDKKLISTREIERFRNNLSWKYRLRNYITEPKAIFESRYEIFVFAPRGLAKTSIYAPRRSELSQLSSIPYAVTIAIEFWDTISPRLQSLLSFFGRGVVFILTQVVGRSLGLVGRGILQGIGSVSLPKK